MAFKLRHWLLTLVFGMAFLAIRGLPTPGGAYEEFLRRRLSNPLHPERERFTELRDSLVSERDRLERLVWLDSLTRVVAAAGRGGAAVAVGAEPDLPPGKVAEFAGVVVREVDARADGEPGVDVGVFVVKDAGAQPRPSDEFYFGEREGRPFCLVLRVARSPGPEHLAVDEHVDERQVRYMPTAPRTRVLGPCSFPVRYGPPGPAIASWLEAGAFGRGARDRVPATYLRARRQSRLFGSFPFHPFEVSARGKRCLEGSAAACREVFIAGGTIAGNVERRVEDVVTELWASDPDGVRGRDFGLADPALFSDLEREFGEGRFARFWTAQEEDPLTAFEAAFGIDAGAWVGSWARSYYGEGRAALRAGAGDWVTTVLMVLGALALAVFAARRRQVA